MTSSDLLKVPEAAAALGYLSGRSATGSTLDSSPPSSPPDRITPSGSTGASCFARSAARGSDHDDDQALVE